MITVPALTKPFVQAIRKAYEKLSIPRGRAYLQDYKESFYFHTLYQKPEIWTRKVGLFQFEEEDVSFESLSMNHRTKPVTAQVEEGKTIHPVSYTHLDVYKRQCLFPGDFHEHEIGCGLVDGHRIPCV